jgi:hypothetical protein
MTAVASAEAPRAAAGPARRFRRAAIAVALLTTLNALAWGLIIPPFHVPDETSHVFYAQYLGETGKLPPSRPQGEWYSADEARMLARFNFYSVIGQSSLKPPAYDNTKALVARDNRETLDRVGTGNASTASNNPPLYYLPQAAVYRATHGLSFLQRLAFMRVLSALMAGLTALCVFAFLREVLPGSPLAWTVGALLAGVQPMFAFISAGVNNDAGLYLVSAALLLALARLMRRGLTPARAAAAGSLLAAGVLVKTQMLAFAPAVGLAFLVALQRGRGSGRPPLKALAAGAAACAAPLVLYGVLGATVWNRPLFDRVGEVAATPAPATAGHLPTISEQLSFLWQEYLPRLPFMTDLLPGLPLWNLWFKGMVGNFGWLDYGYPSWAYGVALGIVALVTVTAAVHLWRRRDAVLRHAGEASVYVVAAGGLAVVVAIVSYRSRISTGEQFEQARYLLPLLPLFALIPALAVKAAGKRFAPLVGVLLVLAGLSFSLFAQLLTLARYYG